MIRRTLWYDYIKSNNSHSTTAFKKRKERLGRTSKWAVSRLLNEKCRSCDRRSENRHYYGIKVNPELGGSVWCRLGRWAGPGSGTRAPPCRRRRRRAHRLAVHHHSHDELLAGLAVARLPADEEEEAVAVELEGGVAVVELQRRPGGVAAAVAVVVNREHRVVIVPEICMEIDCPPRPR